MSVNHLTNLYGSSNTADSLRTCLVLEVGASFLVPFFLDSISSDLIRQTKADKSKLFVFAGFCLLFAISSRAFIKNLSDKVVKEVHDARNTAEVAIRESEQAQKQIEANITVGLLYDEAQFYLDNGHLAMALNSYDRIMAMHPDSLKPYVKKARVYKLAKKYDEAIEQLTAGIEKCPQDPFIYQAFYNRACYKTLSGSHAKDEIINDLRRAIDLHPVYKQYAPYDPDLGALHDDPDFKRITT
jgi:tetratricopeptide (TPR) repeat protein